MSRKRSNIFSHEGITRLDKSMILPSVKIKDNVESDIMFKNRAETLDQKIAKYKSFPDDGTTIIIYTDGSTYNNGRKNAKSGYGVFFGNRDITPISRPVSPMEKQSNNVAELMAIHDALVQIQKEKTGRKIIIYSDSAYSMDVITGKKQAHTNLDIIARIKKVKSACVIPVEFIHIYAHTDKQDKHSIGNDIADYLAGLASK